tara:strand:+ start:533 stop:652 length:120 start_codon:yes stop_codon:yes gene_type:complete
MKRRREVVSDVPPVKMIKERLLEEIKPIDRIVGEGQQNE